MLHHELVHGDFILLVRGSGQGLGLGARARVRGQGSGFGFTSTKFCLSILMATIWPLYLALKIFELLQEGNTDRRDR